MPWTALEPAQWAQQQFAGVNLRDKRLNKRLISVATMMARDAGGSIPQQNKLWAQTKGAYRLFNHQRVTFDAVSQPHWQQTRQQCQQQPGVVLLIQDTTWLDYSAHPSKEGMGWCGSDQSGSGLFLHSVLAVRPHADAGAQVLGVAWGTIWARQATPVGPDQKRRTRRRHADDRESLRWIQAIKQIGSPGQNAPPQDTCWLHVGDRESDFYDVYDQSRQHPGVGFVVRLSKDRNASLGHDTPDTAKIGQRIGVRIKDICRAMPLLGGRQLWIKPRGDRPARWANLSISAAAVTLWSPQTQRKGRALRCWAVRVWEQNPPPGQEAVEWIILTSQKVDDLEDAVRIVGYYALRWLIEEYHQCLKSGCKVEERQLETAQRLEPMIGMFCAVAARLLQLKNDARLAPDAPATECAPRELVQTLAKLKKLDVRSLTTRRFVHEVAKLGGFLGRKGDGEPGWRTLWQGWHELELINQGYQLASEP